MIRHGMLIGMIAAALSAWPMTGTARTVRVWTYEALFAEADLVVLVTPIKTEVTKDQRTENQWHYELVGRNTLFEVEHVLKGHVEKVKMTMSQAKALQIIEDRKTAYTPEDRMMARQLLRDKQESQRIQVLHFKFGKLKEEVRAKGFQSVPIIDGPDFVAFTTDGAAKSTDVDIVTRDRSIEYLLFLKLRKDGRYEPVTGQIDSAESAREVFPSRASYGPP